MVERKEYIIVVTGAAPFKENESNPTQDLKKSLPERIDREGRKSIRIIKYHIDFRNVITDMDLIPLLWNQNKKVLCPDAEEGEKIYVDAAVHLGMHPQDIWTVEKRARRDGYDWIGDDGVRIPEHNGGKDGMFEGLPAILNPSFDVDAIAKKLKKDTSDLPTGASTDAGLKYCELILYKSLAALEERGEEKRALFLHHPADRTASKDIKDGVDVVLSVITAIVEQLESQ